MLLDVTELRTFVTTSLEDSALQALLDANEAAIVGRYGPTGEITEVHTGGLSVLALKRPVASISSISETSGNTTTPLEVPEDGSPDYLFEVGSEWLTRSPYGPNSGSWWGPRVTVVYTPYDDTADRKRVQLKLSQLDINNTPGVTAMTIGEWQESFAQNSVFNYGIEREAILASLNEAAGPLFW